MTSNISPFPLFYSISLQATPLNLARPAPLCVTIITPHGLVMRGSEKRLAFQPSWGTSGLPPHSAGLRKLNALAGLAGLEQKSSDHHTITNNHDTRISCLPLATLFTMGNKVSLEDELINLKIVSKQMQRSSKKCQKNEKAAIEKLKKVSLGLVLSPMLLC